MESNEIIDRLPKHLHKLIIEQPYNDYTAQDHALWRYVMRQNVHYLGTVAHGSYLNGLKKTGISTEYIPHMYGMNRILKDIGWAAVAVDGFIPPSMFMEFQANNVLVIAADIRPIEQIGYTPAPDIIHEAAGHAPIIADPAYAEYLRKFGQAGAKAFSSPYDKKLYEAIRHLSILKADPNSKAEEIENAEKNLDKLSSKKVIPSELALIRNLHWWTVEYGLIGSMDNPKIYGAGLLSSIAESYRCLQPIVKKIPYSINAVNYNFNITEPQPQLFVTQDFNSLSLVLEEFTRSIAYRKGGLDGINKAIASEENATIVLSSGVQVSGIFSEVIVKNNKAVYYKTTGPTQLCYSNHEISGHGKNYHSMGFGSPLGKLRYCAKPLEEMQQNDLNTEGLIEGKKVELEFESGLVVEGLIKAISIRNGKLVLMSFADCTVLFEGQRLFKPGWGIFDMAAAEHISSAFTGVADPASFGLEYSAPSEKTHRIVYSEKAVKLHALYKNVRDTREGRLPSDKLSDIWTSLKKDHHEDWLCALEILELFSEINSPVYNEIYNYLSIKSKDPNFSKLIKDGLALLPKVDVIR